MLIALRFLNKKWASKFLPCETHRGARIRHVGSTRLEIILKGLVLIWKKDMRQLAVKRNQPPALSSRFVCQLT